MDYKEKTKTEEATKKALSEPGHDRVVLLNDDYTAMDFVIKILVNIFYKNETEANAIMLDVHQKGRGLVGVYSWDIAVTKTEQVRAEAKLNGYPLQCVLERA
jgi:ATP-dependent Clp protease adaptor protein ClpS